MPDTFVSSKPSASPDMATKQISGKAKGEVYILARVTAEFTHEVRNSLIKVNNIIPNYGGSIVGVAHPVKMLDKSSADWKTTMSMMILQFPSLELASRWSESDPVFRDKDFPRKGFAVQMIAVPLEYIPPPEFKTFQMSLCVISDVDLQRFQTEFIEEAAKFYEKHKVCFGVALTQDIKDMRPGWINPRAREFILLTLFTDEIACQALYNNSEYETLKAKMNCLCVSNTVCFTIK